MSIRLLDYRAVQVHFIPSPALLEYFEDMQQEQVALPSIYYNAIFPETSEEDKNDFLIHFKLDIKAPLPEENDDDGVLKVDFIARFSSKEPITQEFKDSNFPRVNAPAIAYPFIRAFVNNFFINSGYNPVLLPTYNFTKSVQEVAE